MVPDEIDEYVDGDVRFTIHHFNNPHLFNTYWVSAGVAVLELREDDIVSLKSMLDDYFGTDDPVRNYAALGGFLFGLVLTMLIVVLFGARFT